jgi:alkylated DNA repair protein alkB family protein 1
MPAEAIGPGISQSDQVGENLFRRAEKLYARKLVQRIKQRHGKAHGGKIMMEATDISGVFDLRACLPPSPLSSPNHHPLPDGICAHSITLDLNHLPALSPPPHPSSLCSSGHSNIQSSLIAFTFHPHPGLIIIPSALPASLQSSLMRAALNEYIEPPANTNHTAKHGHLPHGLYRAALENKVLTSSSLSSSDRPAGVNSRSLEQPESSESPQQTRTDMIRVDHLLSSNDEEGEDPENEDNKDDKGEVLLKDSEHNSLYPLRPVNRRTPHSAQPHSLSSHRLPNYNWSDFKPATSSSASHRIATARQLLTKLRWATLGPQFDWTHRSYQETASSSSSSSSFSLTSLSDPSLNHQKDVSSKVRPLPSVLKEIALLIDRSISHLYTRPNGDHTEGKEEKEGFPASNKKQFRPDAAIVNFYREGDTLGGHLDDVEPDMSQPIIGISLGCDGIFLIGGDRRDIEPTALVLRSGDVVILSGDARCCYHGVPRVVSRFEDLKESQGKELKVSKSSLNNDASYFDTAVDSNDGEDESGGVMRGGEEGREQSLLRAHMRGTRINISIRGELSLLDV